MNEEASFVALLLADDHERVDARNEGARFPEFDGTTCSGCALGGQHHSSNGIQDHDLDHAGRKVGNRDRAIGRVRPNGDPR